jgi:hypothetical protein
MPYHVSFAGPELRITRGCFDTRHFVLRSTAALRFRMLLG